MRLAEGPPSPWFRVLRVKMREFELCGEYPAVKAAAIAAFP